jgi:hypothetical protein
MRKRNKNATAVQRRLDKKVEEERFEQRIAEYKKQLKEKNQLKKRNGD